MKLPRHAVSLVLLCLVFAACGRETIVDAPPTSPGAPTPAPVGFSGPVTVRFGEHAVRAEVAATSEQRSRGLMFRTSLERDAGMLFIFPAPNQTGFWMKNTLVPLSIAYLRGIDGAEPRADAGEGTLSGRVTTGGSGDEVRPPARRYTVVDILDMQPCRADPCPSYTPREAYDAALEVNQGWFAERGIAPGAEASVEGDLPTPS